MGALCAGQRNVFLEESIKIREEAGVRMEPEFDENGKEVRQRISTVKRAEISSKLVVELSRPAFLEKCFDNYAVANKDSLQPDEFVLLVTNLVDLDKSDASGLALRFETVEDEHEILSRIEQQKLEEDGDDEVVTPSNIVLQQEKESLKQAALDKRLARSGIPAVVKKMYKAMNLKRNSEISKADFISRFKVKHYIDSLNV